MVALIVLVLLAKGADLPARTGQNKEAQEPYEGVCRDAARESSYFLAVEARVESAPTPNQVVLRGEEHGKLIGVRIVGVKAPPPTHDAARAARAELGKLVGARVLLGLQPSSGLSYQPNVVGTLSAESGDVGLELIRKGLGGFEEPPPYFLSEYTKCVYRHEERRARESRRGIWADPEPPAATLPPPLDGDQLAYSVNLVATESLGLANGLTR